MKQKFNLKQAVLWLVILLVAAGGIFVAVLFKQGKLKLQVTYANPRKNQIAGTAQNVQPSQADFPSLNQNFDQLSAYYKNLAEKKGARYGYEVLKVAPVQPNIDLHLLGHVVGDVLYKQEGLNGITACDNDFRNACSHSIVIGLFYDKGDGALADISEACRKAPGGSGAYTMCFHGLGHGILAYEGYDMEKAMPLCEKTGTAAYGYSEATQCIGGMVMEIVGGGFHDRDKWTVQRKRFLNPQAPLSLCQSALIPSASKFMCYEYITPYLFEVAGADPGNPTAQNFKKAFKYCDVIPQSESQNRDSCYGGLGKEFDGLVQARDIRQSAINNIPNDKLSQIYQWCLLADNKPGQAACIVHALNSLYWGGENNRDVSERFCAQVNDGGYFQKTCYENLITAVSYYINDPAYRQSFCSELPQAYLSDCKNQLKLPQ